MALDASSMASGGLFSAAALAAAKVPVDGIGLTAAAPRMAELEALMVGC